MSDLDPKIRNRLTAACNLFLDNIGRPARTEHVQRAIRLMYEASKEHIEWLQPPALGVHVEESIDTSEKLG
jgi:hypothetical protein